MADEEKEETTTDENTTDVEEPEDSLETILAGEEAEEEPEQKAAPEEKPEEEKEEAAEEGEEKAEPVEAEDLTDEQVAELPPKEQGFYKSMKAERGKRQEMQKGFDEAVKAAADTKLLLAQATDIIKNSQLPAATKAEETPKAEPVDFWENPTEFISQALEGVTGKISAGNEQAQKDRMTLFESAASLRHEDFAEVSKLFMDTLLSHPDKQQAEQVRLSVINSADPAEAAYQNGLKLRTQAEVAEAGGFDALVAKKVAEGLAKAQETAEVVEADEVVKAALPTSMANRRAAGGAAKPLTGFESDQSMSEILGGR